MVKYFGENPKTTPPSVFFPVFVRFVKAYKVSRCLSSLPWRYFLSRCLPGAALQSRELCRGLPRAFRRQIWVGRMRRGFWPCCLGPQTVMLSVSTYPARCSAPRQKPLAIPWGEGDPGPSKAIFGSCHLCRQVKGLRNPGLLWSCGASRGRRSEPRHHSRGQGQHARAGPAHDQGPLDQHFPKCGLKVALGRIVAPCFLI